MNSRNLTEELLEKGESARIEFIASSGEEDSIGRAVCALLNTKGGSILIGVDDCGQVLGVLTEEDADALRSFLHRHITPQVLFTVTLDDVQGGSVVSVDVPEGSDRPYVFRGAVYIKKGSKIRPVDASTMREMVVRQSRETERWERRVAVGLAIDDLDRKLLDETVRRAQDRRGYQFADAHNPGIVLADLALARFGQMTNAADVLFGKRVALRHPQTRLRAVRYETDRGENFIDEQLYEGPAFHLLEEAMAFLKRHVTIGAEFKPGQLARESRPQYPFNSLREGLVNALVHRDYAAFSGGVSVSIYPERIEIWNSGHLSMGLTPGKLRAPTHESILVNPDISHVFYLHELMERVGRGTFKIVQECRAMRMRPPVWQSKASGVHLTFFGAGQVQIPVKLNERQRALLDGLKNNESIRMDEYIERAGSGISDRQARRDLRNLVDTGFLDPIGAGPATAYRRTEEEI
jgi:ATP-dependent DNA helicase RecG